MLTHMFDFSVLVKCFKEKSLRIAADRDFCTVVLNNMTFLFALDVTCSYLPPPRKQSVQINSETWNEGSKSHP